MNLKMSKQEIIIIGGGAAGFFTAINIAEKHEDFKVIILENELSVSLYWCVETKLLGIFM